MIYAWRRPNTVKERTGWVATLSNVRCAARGSPSVISWSHLVSKAKALLSDWWIPLKGGARISQHRREVFDVFIWICNNWVGASQLDARQPIRTYFNETTTAVYRPMRRASRDVEQTIQLSISNVRCAARIYRLEVKVYWYISIGVKHSILIEGVIGARLVNHRISPVPLGCIFWQLWSIPAKVGV